MFSAELFLPALLMSAIAGLAALVLAHVESRTPARRERRVVVRRAA